MIRSNDEEQMFVKVTQNLASALVPLRHVTEPRVFWIDALCINQQDESEKSSQVVRMSDIYRLADRVIVWLGPEDEGSKDAVSILRHIGSQVEVDWKCGRMQPVEDGERLWADIKEPLPLKNPDYRLIHDLLNRSWFERLWVQQEIGLANEKAIIICGLDSIDWRQFSDAIYCLYVRSRPYDKDQELLSRLRLPVEMAYSKSRRDGLPYATVLRKQTKLKCADPRDRIFAVLSASSPSKRRGNIQPDYSKTVEFIYRDFTLKQIMHENLLNILATNEISPEGPLNGLPTWVPDWRRPIYHQQIINHSASGRSLANVKFDNNKTLTVTGVKIATISQVEIIPLFEGPSGYFPTVIANSIRRMVQLWGTSERYMEDGSVHHAYIRTLCSDTFSHFYNPPNYNFPDFEMGRIALEFFLTYYGEFSFCPDHERFISQLLRSCEGRSYYVTQQGYIGLAPVETRVGDIICVLLGCDVPMVLRPIGPGKFSLVGECYCDGVMDGAALLGLLPEGFRFLWNFEEGMGTYCAGYIDRRSGKVQGEDPRLTGHPLPPRWRIEKKSEISVVVTFVEEYENGTDKTRTEALDPRMSPVVLRQRGVDIIEFDLV
jgi:hypothetical protein